MCDYNISIDKVGKSKHKSQKDSNAVCLGSHDKNTVWKAACLSPGLYTLITLMIFFTYKVDETHCLGQCPTTNDILILLVHKLKITFY